MTKRESILQALLTVLQTIPDVSIERNTVTPEQVPNSGLIILRDGEAGEPEVLLSPLSYLWEHHAELEVLVQEGEPVVRDLALDTLFKQIAEVLGQNPTLGGLCDRVLPLAPQTSTLAIDGGVALKAALVPVRLIFVTTDQLG